MSANLYEARNLVQRYNGREALSVQHFAIEEGEAVFLTGPNGCGKSTLLRLLAFLERPAEGVLRYAGGAEGRKEATLLLQDPYLLHMSVFNNVALGLKFRNQTGELRQVFERCMQAAGFDDPWNFADRGPRELSGGERQRVAIARALVNNPRLVLADEPTGNLDARNADSIFQLLGELNRLQGTAFLVVTHDLQLAKRMSRQLEMRDGRLTAELSLMGAE